MRASWSWRQPPRAAGAIVRAAVLAPRPCILRVPQHVLKQIIAAAGGTAAWVLLHRVINRVFISSPWSWLVMGCGQDCPVVRRGKCLSFGNA